VTNCCASHNLIDATNGPCPPNHRAAISSDRYSHPLGTNYAIL